MSLAESKSFMQYKYCSLCRMSCKKFKKHVHSQGHQKIVKNILTKFSKKISDARIHIDEPVVKEITWHEAEKQLWCYFCQLDVSQHLRKTTTMGECIVLNGGFLGHMTREDHVENTTKFLKDNIIDMTRTPEFILSSDNFLKFLETVEKICVDFFANRHLALKKVAVAIEAQCAIRRHVVAEGLLEQSQSCRVQAMPHENSSLKSKEGAEPVGRKTVKAFGVGLTIVERINEDDTKGNIHSNALPPWILEDPEEEKDSYAEIGPSLTDFEKHKKLEKKRQLPACRVGAKFDRTTSHSEDWLPNFGGVWSHGPRTKSGQQFHRRQFHHPSSNVNVTEERRMKTSISGQHGQYAGEDFETTSHSQQLQHSPHHLDYRNHHHKSHHHLQQMPSHQQANSSSNLTLCAESSYSDHPLYHTADNYFGQGIRPYVSKRKRKSTYEDNGYLNNNVVKAKPPNGQPGLSPFNPSIVSEECSSFSSNHHDQGYNKTPTFSVGKAQVNLNSMQGRFETHFVNMPSIKLLSTPVLNVKKK